MQSKNIIEIEFLTSKTKAGAYQYRFRAISKDLSLDTFSRYYETPAKVLNAALKLLDTDSLKHNKNHALKNYEKIFGNL